MKSLLIMRHAKSSWKETDIPDFERPLNKRGKGDAPAMGELLKDRELIPQRILCSTAARARQTVDGLLGTSGFHGEVVYLDSFYMAESITYLESLRLLADDLERVMIVGHNPGLETLLQMLTGKVAALPTAAVAYLALPINHWTELKPDTEAELAEFWIPRNLLHEEEKAAEAHHKKKSAAKDKKAKK